MKEYKCICGKIFDNPQKFNGHKQGCSEHIISKYGSLEAYYTIKNRNHDRGRKVKERIEGLKTKQLEIWIQEKHICERCGKVMTERWGSGRFCSRKCANSHTQSEECKQKISKTVNSKEYTLRKNNILEYEKSPNRCPICGKILSYDQRYNKVCSFECSKKYNSDKMLKKISSGELHITVRKRYKYGIYKGIHCDSSWELAFVMYLFDHGVEFKRNIKESFLYYYKGSYHYFFPDFIINDEYYELKGYESEQTGAKIKYFPKNKVLHVLYYKELKRYIDYAIDTYGKDYYKLYDVDKPSWMNKV